MKSIKEYILESANAFTLSEKDIAKAGNAFYVCDNGDWYVILDDKKCYLSEDERESEEGAIAIGTLAHDYAEKHSESILNDLKKAVDRYIPKKWLDSNLVVWDKEKIDVNSKVKYELIKKFD